MSCIFSIRVLGSVQPIVQPRPQRDRKNGHFEEAHKAEETIEGLSPNSARFKEMVQEGWPKDVLLRLLG